MASNHLAVIVADESDAQMKMRMMTYEAREGLSRRSGTVIMQEMDRALALTLLWPPLLVTVIKMTACNHLFRAFYFAKKSLSIEK